jgi:hypothetical protein
MSIEARSKGRIRMREGQRVVVKHATLSHEDHSSRQLLQFVSMGSRLEGCNFDHARIESASFGGGQEMSEFTDCTFDGARMNMGPGGFARFVRCSFNSVDISNWICFAVELVDCKFGGRLRRAVFNGTIPEDKRIIIGRSYNEFSGNDFSAMDLIDVSFRAGINLAQQILPPGDDYLYLPYASAAVDRARSRVIGWNNHERRRVALAIIEGLEYNLAGGQRQLFIRESDYYSISAFPREVVDEVFALLRENGKIE